MPRTTDGLQAASFSIQMPYRPVAIQTMMNRTAAAAVGRTLNCQLRRGRPSSLAHRISRAEDITVAVSDQPSLHRRTQTRTRCYLMASSSSPGSAGAGSSTSTQLSLPQHVQHQSRSFQNEAGFHEVADESLEAIQDAVEELFEDHFEGSGGAADDSEVPEVNVASGVLTLSMPPHGTWVLNKQTPNRQIWWSSPISGPRRYEYDAKEGTWLYTRYVDAKDAAGDDGTDLNEDEFGDGKTLGGALAAEIKMLYGLDADLDI